MFNRNIFRIAALLCGILPLFGQAPEGAQLAVTSTVREGETASGSVIGLDGGALTGVVVEVDGKDQTTDDQGHFPIPVAASSGNQITVLLRTAGDAAERVNLPILDPVGATAPRIEAAPVRVLSHESIRLGGEGFSPTAAENAVTIGGHSAPVLASSSGELVISPSGGPSGSQPLVVRTPAGETQAPIQIINVRLRNADTALTRGKRGDAVLELEGTNDRLRLEIVNEAPQVIRLNGGDRQTIRSSGGAGNSVRLRYRGVGAGGFRLTVKLAQGESGVQEPSTPQPQTERAAGRPETRPAGPPTAPVPVRTRKCVLQPRSVRIDSWDVIGDLYRNHGLGRQPGVSFDEKHISEKFGPRVSEIRNTIKRLELLFAGFGAKDRLGKCKPPKLAAQSFPPFPDLTFEIDLCSPGESHRLADYLSAGTNMAALEDWFQAHGKALDNFGLPGDKYGAGQYSARNISGAMAKLEDASKEFQNTMATSMALSYNRRAAEAKLFKGIVMSIGVVLSAASAGSGGVVIGALAGASPGLADEAIQAAGGKLTPYGPGASDLTDAIEGLGGEFSPSSFATGVMGAGGEVLAGQGRDLAAKLEASGANRQEFTRNISLAMAILNDDIWNNTIKLLAEEDGYLGDAIRRFNEYRRGLRIEVDRQLAELCPEYAKLKALLPAIEAAEKEAERRAHADFYKEQYRKLLADSELDCLCCRYSDGSGPRGACRITLSTKQ